MIHKENSMKMYGNINKRVFIIYIAAAVLMIVTAALLLGGCKLSLDSKDNSLSTVKFYFARETLKNGSSVKASEGPSSNIRAIPDAINRVQLTVEGEDMETVEVDIQLQESDTYTITIPSGDARTFTLAAFNSDGVKKYEGSVTRNLEAGKEITISIDLSF